MTIGSNLTLTIQVENGEQAQWLTRELRRAGFDAQCAAPFSFVWWEVRVHCSPSTVNYGPTMWDELKAAWEFAVEAAERKEKQTNE